MSGFVDEESVNALVEQLRDGITTLAGAGAEGKQAGTFFVYAGCGSFTRK
jgi:hypothetical protein